MWALHQTGLELWFKGGTSLSKGYGVIQRFSEDLDLMVQQGRALGLGESRLLRRETRASLSCMSTEHTQLGAGARLVNGLVGKLFRMGWAPSYGHELEVVGRKSGQVHKTPVNLLEHEGTTYLVAPRGETQWVKNARVAGEVTLVRKASRLRCHVAELPVEKRAPILKAYYVRYEGQVKSFFSIAADSPIEVYEGIAARHPVFVLSPA
jgi:deazaflavin-dependent oxidoreductase (nitroreductase family)